MAACILFARKEIYKKLFPKKVSIIDNHDDPDSNFDHPTDDGTYNRKTKMSHNYIFPSFFEFVVQGPLVEDIHQIDAF